MAERSRGAEVGVTVHDLGGIGRPLLISHATGFHGRCYDPLAKVLGERFHSVSFDYRGHGDTPSPPGWRVEWEGYADDAMTAAQWLVASEGGPLVGFGHSMGATCLLICAYRDPALFSSLVLFEPIVVPPGVFDADELPGSGLAAGARRRRATFPSLDDAYDNFASKPPLDAWDRVALRGYVEHGFRETTDGVTLKCTPSHEAATFEAGQRQRTWEILPTIETPCAILTGRDDGSGPATMAPPVAARVPGAALIRLDELDHFGPMTDPHTVAGLIVDNT